MFDVYSHFCLIHLKTPLQTPSPCSHPHSYFSPPQHPLPPEVESPGGSSVPLPVRVGATRWRRGRPGPGHSGRRRTGPRTRCTHSRLTAGPHSGWRLPHEQADIRPEYTPLLPHSSSTWPHDYLFAETTCSVCSCISSFGYAYSSVYFTFYFRKKEFLHICKFLINK